MTREEIYREVEEAFGEIPTSIKKVPDEFLEEEWRIWKALTLEQTRIPAKYRELICLAACAAIGDDYDSMYYRESAKAFGVSDEELREVAYLLRQALGWGAFMRVNGVTVEDYRAEVYRQMSHFAAQMEGAQQKPSI